MSTLSRQRGEPDVDLSSDLMPEVRTTRVIERENAAKSAEAKVKKTKVTTEE